MNKYALALENEVYAIGENGSTPDDWAIIAFRAACSSKRIKSFGKNKKAAQDYLLAISYTTKHPDKGYDIYWAKPEINEKIEKLPKRFGRPI